MKNIEIASRTPIEKGWSGDKKYRAVDADGRAYLLRVSPLDRRAAREQLFALLTRNPLPIRMSEPISCEVREDGVYALWRWVDGEDLEAALPSLPEAEAYALGLRAGEALTRIHAIPAPADQEPWEPRFSRKIDRKLKMYAECPLQYEDGGRIAAYVRENRGLIANRPQCFQHGDYHVGNMMLERGEVAIIDFDRCDFGDPWEEFNRIVWCAQASPAFATGMVNGYFGGAVPELFWRLLALYICSNMLSSLPWAIPFGEEEVATMRRQAAQVLSWYEGMSRVVPTWYQGALVLQRLDGVPFRLRTPHDFGFLKKYGAVFAAFDDQDSGNLCFGLRDGASRVFVKYAGAQTARMSGTPGEAMARLRAAAPVYRALAHESLIRLIEAGPVGGGYWAVFDWADGDCAGRQYPAAHTRFMALPMADKLRAYQDLLDFHAHVAGKGYVAIDFYDGSILYDAASKKTTVCDVDFYAPMPYVNRMGRMWGSSRFLSPEETTLGAVIDERTNVYTMGATAFALFADGDRSREAWPLSGELYAVANRAVSASRDDRQASIARLIREWRAAQSARF